VDDTHKWHMDMPEIGMKPDRNAQAANRNKKSSNGAGRRKPQGNGGSNRPKGEGGGPSRWKRNKRSTSSSQR